MGTGAGIIAGSLISVGGSLYSAKKQQDAIDEATAEQEEAARLAEEEARRIFEAAEPAQPSATLTFGTGEDKSGLGSYQEFLTPKTSTSKKQNVFGNPLTSTLGFGS